MRKILVLNGPNLDIMGKRKEAGYRGLGLSDIEAMVSAEAAKLGVTVDFRQSNHEGVLIDWIHEALDDFDGVIINPTSLTHGSLPLADALGALSCPVIELHFANVHRDPSKADRQKSLVRRVATGVIAGFGPRGYVAAMNLMNDLLSEAETQAGKK